MLVEPRKGPLGARVAAQVEEGIGKSLAAARERPIRFGLIEATAGFGGGFGSQVAQNLDPYDPSSRLVGEILGAGLVPLPAEILIDSGPKPQENWLVL